MHKLLTIFFGLALGCQAAGIFTVTFVPPTVTAGPGDLIAFSGTLQNNDAQNDIYINSDSFTLAGFVLDDTPFLTFAPLFLAPGATTAVFEFFTVSIPGNQPPGNYGGTFTVIGGPDGGAGTAQDNLGTGAFTVGVPLPEPATLGLLLGGAALLAARRRRR